MIRCKRFQLLLYCPGRHQAPQQSMPGLCLYQAAVGRNWKRLGPELVPTSNSSYTCCEIVIEAGKNLNLSARLVFVLVPSPH